MRKRVWILAAGFAWSSWAWAGEEWATLASQGALAYGKSAQVTLRRVDGADSCDYLGRAKWERASLPGGWSWALDAERKAVFRMSVEVDRKRCGGQAEEPASFVARFGEVVVDAKEGKSLPAGFLTRVEAKALGLAKR